MSSEEAARRVKRRATIIRDHPWRGLSSKDPSAYEGEARKDTPHDQRGKRAGVLAGATEAERTKDGTEGTVSTIAKIN